MLWLALHFPLLPLEALPLRQSPSALVSRGRVCCVDRAAAEAGVGRGQKLSTALGLAPSLSVFERDAGREVAALASLACWAGRFTPTVSLAAPDALLLEIGGCLRLFGGAEAIIAAVEAGCREQSYSLAWAAAPTPLGALWLARAGQAAIHVEASAMQAALADLSCAVPGWPNDIVARLDAFGLRRLGDLRRQPAAALRRRIGNGPLDDLLRAWGEIPHPQLAFVFPESFRQAIELPARVEHAEALAFAGQRLFSALTGWLQVRQLLVRACVLQLTHDDRSTSELPLRFAEPAADEVRFARLLREHLGRLQLRAPVEALCLRAEEVTARPGASAGLFEQAVAGEGLALCLERLQARLGAGAVRVLAGQADHRPECATGWREPDLDLPISATSTAEPVPPRPLWLLPAPQALREERGRPCWQGPLSLQSRAERLESGWWDEGEAGAAGDLRRDYFVARNPHGQWAWIFRDREGWFLHGLFA
ncbi:MAG: DNA polymerase Y family protein [Azonexus sp.]